MQRGARDRRLPRIAQVEAVEGVKDAALEHVKHRSREAKRPAVADGDADDLGGREELGEPRGNVAQGHAGLPTNLHIGPRRDPEPLDRGMHPRLGVQRGEPAEAGGRRAVAAADARTSRLDDPATSQRRRGALLAEDERLARHGHHFRFRQELAERRFARFEPVAIRQRQRREDFGRPQMQAITCAVLERPRRVGRGRDLDAEDPRRLQVARHGQLLSPKDLGVVCADHVDRGPHPFAHPVGRSIVAVQAPDAKNLPVREPFQFVAHGDPPGDDGPGHDGAEAGSGEGPINRHAERPGVGPR